MNTAFLSLWAVCVLLFFSITVFSSGMGFVEVFVGGVRREHELVVAHGGAEQRRGEERQRLGQQHAADKAHGQRDEAHEHRLVQPPTSSSSPTAW